MWTATFIHTRILGFGKKTKKFVLVVYNVTEKFPQSELYGLTTQMRRAAISMPSNIAEGFRKGSKKEKLQFLRSAYGSGAELETQLEISCNIGYLDIATLQSTMEELDGIMKMINKAIRSLSV